MFVLVRHVRLSWDLSQGGDVEMAVRLKVNINDKTAEVLKKHAEGQDTSVTEQVRRAVEIYDFIQEAFDRGEDIIIERPRKWREPKRLWKLTLL